MSFYWTSQNNKKQDPGNASVYFTGVWVAHLWYLAKSGFQRHEVEQMLAKEKKEKERAVRRILSHVKDKQLRVSFHVFMSTSSDTGVYD